MSAHTRMNLRALAIVFSGIAVWAVVLVGLFQLVPEDFYMVMVMVGIVGGIAVAFVLANVVLRVEARG